MVAPGERGRSEVVKDELEELEVDEEEGQEPNGVGEVSWN